MNENQTEAPIENETVPTDPVQTDPVDGVETPSTGGTSGTGDSGGGGYDGTFILNDPLNVHVDTPYTQFDTPETSIYVVHEITLGDLIISTLLICLIVFTVLARIIRR